MLLCAGHFRKIEKDGCEISSFAEIIIIGQRLQELPVCDIEFTLYKSGIRQIEETGGDTFLIRELAPYGETFRPQAFSSGQVIPILMRKAQIQNACEGMLILQASSNL